MSEDERANSAFLTNLRKSWFKAEFRSPRPQPDILNTDGRGPGDGEEVGSAPHSSL